MPPTATEVPAEQLATITAAVAEGIKPLLTRLDAVEQKATTLAQQAEAVVRYDAAGKTFRWPGGEQKAPEFLRSGVNKDSATLLVSNIWRACMLGKSNPGMVQQLAGEELAMSERLRAAGYMPEYLGSILFPMGQELILEPVDERGQKQGDLTALRKEIAERLPVRLDPGELAWTLKRFPQLAESFGLQRKDLALGDDTLGGYLVPTTQADRIIDLLRARLTVMRAGATEVPLPPSGNIAYPRLTADPTFTWTDPDSTTDASTSNLGTGVVRLQAKSLRGYVTIPNDLLRYSSPSVEMIVRSALASKAAVAEDNAFLEGAGSSLQPKGILNYPASAAEVPAIGKVTLHAAATTATNGDTFGPEDVAKILALYYMGNDPDPPTAWIMRPLMWAAIFNRRADAITAGDAKGPFMFWVSRGSAEANIPEALGGKPVYPSVNASANRVKGSGTTLVYALFGNFRRLLIGRSGVLELAVSEHVKFLQDKTIIRAVERVDSGLEHEESFVFTDTLLES